MKIGQLAKQADVSRDTIRLYERHGLLSSAVDASNNYRIYPEDAVLTLEVIRDAQAAGLSIAEITVFMGQFVAQDPHNADASVFLETKIKEVQSRIAASQRFLEMLEQTKLALADAPQNGLDELEKMEPPGGLPDT
jgi:DNA-binding transcriptional MerR regulator